MPTLHTLKSKFKFQNPRSRQAGVEGEYSSRNESGRRIEERSLGKKVHH
jgi:hypothetical protein